MRLFEGMRYEKRADSSYTDALVQAITANAGGQNTAFPTATSALESCAGLVGRAFASADITCPDYAVEALSPDCLSMIGRALIRRGEILFEVDVSEGQIQLMPASSHDVDGDPDPRTWRYRLNLGGPDLQITRENLGAESVVHIQYAKDPETPWRGVSPLSVAQLAGRLSAETSAALADEASGPRGSFLPMPSKDGLDTTTSALKGDIRTAKGSMLTVESMSTNWNAGQDAPKGDWSQIRFGAMPPDALVKLLGAASVEVMSACGLSADLWLPGDGTGKREAWRQALHGVIAPLGRLVENELRRKLDAPELKLTWQELMASDLQGRARAFQSMIGGGMELAKAAALSGLMMPEEA